MVVEKIFKRKKGVLEHKDGFCLFLLTVKHRVFDNKHYMRAIPTYPNEYYHILNRGNRKQPIFYSHSDYVRFLFLILFLQSPVAFPQINRLLEKNSHSVKHSVFDINVVDREDYNQIIKQRYVELHHFILMPNHFHLSLKETQKGGIQKYMQRILNAYTKSTNTKYNKSGHLFQGPYKNIHVTSNEQFLYLSAYIHLNSREIKEWHSKEDRYPWSSYQDYTHNNRWGDLLVTNVTKEQFTSEEAYRKFVEESGAKSTQDGCQTPGV